MIKEKKNVNIFKYFLLFKNLFQKYKMVKDNFLKYNQIDSNILYRKIVCERNNLLNFKKEFSVKEKRLICFLKNYFNNRKNVNLNKIREKNGYNLPLEVCCDYDKYSFLEFNQLYNMLNYKLSKYGILINNFVISGEPNKINITLELYFQTFRIKNIFNSCLRKKNFLFRKCKTINIFKKKRKNQKEINSKRFKRKYLFFYKKKRNRLLGQIKKPVNSSFHLNQFLSSFKTLLQNVRHFKGKELIVNIVNLNKHIDPHFYFFNLKKKIDRERSRIFIKNPLLYIDLLKVMHLFLIGKLKSVLILKILDKIFVKLNKRKHNAFLKFLNLLFKELIISDSIKIYNKKTRQYTKQNFINSILGVRFELYGRIGGKTRSSSRKIFVGKLKRKQLSKSVFFNKITSITPYGTFGLKLCIYSKTKNELLMGTK